MTLMSTYGKHFGVMIIDNRSLSDINGSNVRKIPILLLILGPRRFLASLHAHLSMQQGSWEYVVAETNSKCC